MGKFRNQNHGIVIDCEGGYFAGDASGGAFFDSQGKKIKDIPDDGSSKTLETAHLSNFLAAVRSRKAGDLAAEALQGHLSAACCHMANISYRLGKQSPPEAIHASDPGATRSCPTPSSAAASTCATTASISSATPATLGAGLTFDPKRETVRRRSCRRQHNALAQREYRKPFVVPKIA